MIFLDKNKIIEQLKLIDKNSFGIIEIGVFGSYAKNKATENSDIDILVKLKKENMYQNYCKTKYFLEDLFKIEIDLITENQFDEKYITKVAEENRNQIRKDIMESVIYV